MYHHPKNKRSSIESPSPAKSSTLENYPPYKKSVSGHFRQLGAGYLINPRFWALYLEHGEDIMEHWKDKTISKEQFLSDRETLFGAIEAFNRSADREKELSKYQDSMDGIKAWIAFLNTCDKGGNQDI